MRVKNVVKISSKEVINELQKIETVKRTKSKKDQKDSKENTWGTWFKKRPSKHDLAKRGILKGSYFGTDLTEVLKNEKVIIYNRIICSIQGGSNIVESFLSKNFGHIGKFGNIGYPFCTGGLYNGNFFAKKFRTYCQIRQYSAGNSGPHCTFHNKKYRTLIGQLLPCC